MTILSRAILSKPGPFIKFAGFVKPLPIPPGEWPSKTLYEKRVFFELADDLLAVFCAMTATPSFFDPYKLYQVRDPDCILAIAFRFLHWSATLAGKYAEECVKCHCLYGNADGFDTDAKPSFEGIRHDRIETLLFLAGRLSQMACQRRYLVLVGI